MEKTKRILIVVTQAEWGGVQGYIFRCAQEARRRGMDVLVAAGGDGLLETRCQESGVPYRRLQKMRREISPIHDIGAMHELIGLIREWNPDTVFLHSSKAGIVGSIAAKIARVPRVVYRIGGWSFLDPVSPRQQQIRLWSEKLTARLKNVIITVHPGDEEHARAHHIRAREQVLTVANGINVEGFDRALLPRAEARTILASYFSEPIAESAPILLSIAHFYPTKDLTGYLRALAMVAQQIPGIRVVILGDGEQRAELEKMRAEYHLTSVVALPGSRADASTLLVGADLFVLSSAKEGMPWTVLEAMAARTPIVTTDVGSNRWALGDAAWIVPPKQPEALAEALIEALRHPEEAAQRAARAREQLIARFTEGTMWEKTFGVL
ncbi:MAG: hypothetical protein RL141_672 [Candidatus Parcubacteria bacterium]|jgi:glycosyltransferase involved in cell wall biosynthesis